MVQAYSEALYLGIDGGGSRCRARLQDAQGGTLGEGSGGPANIRLGLDVAWDSIKASIQAALAQAGLGPDALGRVTAGLGLAGIVTADDTARVIERAVVFGAVAVASDSHTACLGAFAGEDGGIQIIGTGSAGYAIVGGQGRTVGGWGFPLSEKASAAALGRDAIRAALEASDGLAPRTEFTDAVMARFGTAAAIVDWSETARPTDYGTFSPLAFDHAALGDPVAVELVQRIAADCGRFVLHLVAMGAPKVCLAGGVAPHILPWLPQGVTQCLATPQGDALAGALLLARQVSSRGDVEA